MSASLGFQILFEVIRKDLQNYISLIMNWRELFAKISSNLTKLRKNFFNKTERLFTTNSKRDKKLFSFFLRNTMQLRAGESQRKEIVCIPNIVCY